MTSPRCRRASRVFASRIAPPPVASTIRGRCVSSSSSAASRRRKPASPSISKIVGIGTPLRASSSRSASTNSKRSACASKRPIVDLPAPIMPIRKTEFASVAMQLAYVIDAAKKKGRSRGPWRSWFKDRSSHRCVHSLGNHSRGDEDDEFRTVVDLRFVLEQPADDGQVTEERNFGHGRTVLLLVDSAEHDGAAVLDQHLGLNVLRVDRRARYRLLAAAVLVDLDIQEDRALGSDLRRDFELQHGLAERH